MRDPGNKVGLHAGQLFSELFSSLPRSRFYFRHATLFPALRDNTKNGCKGD